MIQRLQYALSALMSNLNSPISMPIPHDRRFYAVANCLRPYEGFLGFPKLHE